MLLGKNVRIRPMESKDFELFYKWMGNEDCIGNHVNSSMYYKESYIENLGILLKDTSSLYCIIEDLESNSIGMIEYRSVIGSSSTLEFGIVIAEKRARMKGYGRECMKLLIDHIFKTKEIMRVQVLINSKNILAKNGAIKCGFKMEGTLKQFAFVQGEYVDFYIMALIREEWLNMKTTNIK